MGAAKGFSEVPPPWHLKIRRLGAPFAANWDDYPMTEKLIYYPLGLLDRFLDPGVAANVGLICAHLFCGFGFYIAARYFGADCILAVGFSLLYALSYYIFIRGWGHIVLSCYGHLPLMLVIFDQALKERAHRRPWAVWGAAGIAAASALLNPYYWFFFLAMAGLIGLVWIARGSAGEGVYALGCMAGSVVIFFLGQTDYYLNAWRHGSNHDAVSRSLNAILENGLRLPSLIWPSFHYIRPWSDFAVRHYFSQAWPIGEGISPFLGIAGVLGLVCLTCACFVKASRGKPVPVEGWAAAFAMAFATLGGLDYLMGSFGFVLLRSVNRYSIIILTCVLIFLSARLFPRLPKLTKYACLILLLLLSAGEITMLQRSFLPAWREIGPRVHSDRVFSKKLEGLLPRGAAIFLLPVWVFPEAVPQGDMPDYDHFRTYVWSDHLRFSYGSDRGRRREQWQSEAAQQPPVEMIRRLEKAGFSALVIERKAYCDNGAEIERGLRQAGIGVLVDSPDRELVAYRLTPEGHPEVPFPTNPTLVLGGDFYGWETEKKAGSRWSWASRSAKLHLFAGTPQSSVVLTFRLNGLKSQKIIFFLDGKQVGEPLRLPEAASRYVVLRWTPAKEKTVLQLRTDTTGKRLQLANDTRVIAFGVFDPELKVVPGVLPEPLITVLESKPQVMIK
ncbi:MAG: hypothetical protein PW734_00890 [Verrucomicrobium sp.]|nr:hypothetical protein [Verrucomicrobium sp.]